MFHFPLSLQCFWVVCFPCTTNRWPPSFVLVGTMFFKGTEQGTRTAPLLTAQMSTSPVRLGSYLAVGQNQWYHVGVGAPTSLVYFSGNCDVHNSLDSPHISLQKVQVFAGDLQHPRFGVSLNLWCECVAMFQFKHPGAAFASNAACLSSGGVRCSHGARRA